MRMGKIELTAMFLKVALFSEILKIQVFFNAKYGNYRQSLEEKLLNSSKHYFAGWGSRNYRKG